MNSRREISSRFTNDMLLKWRDVYFNQSEQGIKSKIDISLILTNHYFYAQNLSVKNGENNSVLAGVPFLSPSRAHTLSLAPKFPLPLRLSTTATQANISFATNSSQEKLSIDHQLT